MTPIKGRLAQQLLDKAQPKPSRKLSRASAPGAEKDSSAEKWQQAGPTHCHTADSLPCVACGSMTHYRVHFPWSGFDQWFCEQCGKKKAQEMILRRNT